MHGIEGIANWGINKYNQKHPDKTLDTFEINPKVKNAIKLISTAIVGIAYTYGTLGTEVDQFANSGIFQTEQYLADIGGSLAGIAAFHKLDIKDTAASFANKIWGLSKAIVKPINSLEEKITGKDNSISQKTSEIEVAQIDIAPEIENSNQEPPVWDLSLYKNEKNDNLNTQSKQNITNDLQKSSHSSNDSNDSNVEDELNF